MNPTVQSSMKMYLPNKENLPPYIAAVGGTITSILLYLGKLDYPAGSINFIPLGMVVLGILGIYKWSK